MVDGAFAFEAGAAIDGFANDAGERSGGSGGDVIGGAEDGDGGHAEGGGDVHGPGIVGDVDAAGGGEIDEFGERGVAREILSRGAEGGGDGGAERALVFRAEDRDGGAEFGGDAIG